MSKRSRVTCYYLGCYNNKMNSPDKCFFKVPGGGERWKIWLTCMGRLDLTTKKRSTVRHSYIRVCSDHFEARYFCSNLRTRLLRGAVPIRATFQNKMDLYCRSPLEESAKGQEQSPDRHTKECCHGDSCTNASSCSTKPHCKHQKTIERATLCETIARNSDAQNTLGCSPKAQDFDAMDHLFLSWAKTVKTFSPHRLIETKREIANTILKQEEEQLKEDLCASQATAKMEEIVRKVKIEENFFTQKH